MSVSDKQTVVTGGSRGIGFAIANAFAEAGADVLLAAKDEDRLDEARRELEPTGVAVDTVSADLTDFDDVTNVIRTVIEAFDAVHVLANVAGAPHFRPLSDVSIESFDEQVDLNLKAPFRLIQGLLPLLEEDGASVINMSSYWSNKMVAGRPSAIYSMTRGGVESLTKALANELGRRDVRVNAIAPGAVRTDGFEESILDGKTAEERREYEAYVERAYPLGRLGQPEEVAEAALYLASDEARWVTGTVMHVNGGMHIR